MTLALSILLHALLGVILAAVIWLTGVTVALRLPGKQLAPVQHGREAKRSSAYTNEELLAACENDGLTAHVGRNGRVYAYEHRNGQVYKTHDVRALIDAGEWGVRNV